MEMKRMASRRFTEQLSFDLEKGECNTNILYIYINEEFLMSYRSLLENMG